MSAAPKKAVIDSQCRELKIPRIAREFEAIVRQASDDNWGYGDFLVHLLELDVRAVETAAGAPGA